MCVLAATLIVTFACLLIPGAAPGYNPEIVPGYAAPGDTVQYRFARRATIDNYWRGKPVAILQHQGAARQPREVRAEASSRDWPETIETKNKDGSGVRPAVDVQIPDDSTLVGQTVELNIEMEIEYPVRSDFEEGKPRYRVEQEHLHASVPVHIVEPGTRDKLFLVWWFSGIVASICLVLPPLLTFLNNNRAMRTSGDAPIEAVETPVDNRQVP